MIGWADVRGMEGSTTRESVFGDGSCEWNCYSARAASAKCKVSFCSLGVRLVHMWLTPPLPPFYFSFSSQRMPRASTCLVVCGPSNSLPLLLLLLPAARLQAASFFPSWLGELNSLKSRERKAKRASESHSTNFSPNQLDQKANWEICACLGFSQIDTAVIFTILWLSRRSFRHHS